MGISRLSDTAASFHEVEVTVHAPEQYAEIMEIYRESVNSPVVVKATSIMVIDLPTGSEAGPDTFNRRQNQ